MGNLFYEQLEKESDGTIQKLEWIPIDSEEPPMFNQVLVTDGNSIDFGYYQGCDHFCLGEEFLDECDITHWMPLPELPENRKGDEI